MALTRIKSSNIADETVVAADIADGSVTDVKIQTGVSASKLTGNLPALSGTALTNLTAANISGALPALSGAALTNLTAANISGALPAIDGSNLTGVNTDTTVIENNLAILAFKTQASNNLAKFNLIAQVIDEYEDTSGIDAGASTNETRAGGAGTYYYHGANSNMTLISTANTALSAPTTGDIVLLIENATGTATLNTDLKAYISRNGGTGWDQATLVDKGSWGTNKKIVSVNDVAFSNSASGTDMRYKIETLNQSGSKVTRIHATSLAWA